MWLTAEGVAVAASLGRAKVEVDDAILVRLREEAPVDRRRLGERAAEAEDLLRR